MAQTTTIKETIHSYILREFLPGVPPDELTESTPLITGGIVDSLATLKLVMFLEEQFGIDIAAHEASVDYLNTIEQIEGLIQSKV
jgi:acyl carrier protein